MDELIYAFIMGALAYLVFKILIPILPGLGSSKGEDEEPEEADNQEDKEVK